MLLSCGSLSALNDTDLNSSSPLFWFFFLFSPLFIWTFTVKRAEKWDAEWIGEDVTDLNLSQIYTQYVDSVAGQSVYAKPWITFGDNIFSSVALEMAMNGSDWNISTTVEWIDMKYFTDFYKVPSYWIWWDPHVEDQLLVWKFSHTHKQLIGKCGEMVEGREAK